MKQKQSITDILNSINSMQKVESNPFLHTRILLKLEQPVTGKKVPLKMAYLFAACFIVLLTLNIFIWSVNTNDKLNDSANSVVNNEYDLTTIEY